MNCAIIFYESIKLIVDQVRFLRFKGVQVDLICDPDDPDNEVWTADLELEISDAKKDIMGNLVLLKENWNDYSYFLEKPCCLKSIPYENKFRFGELRSHYPMIICSAAHKHACVLFSALLEVRRSRIGEGPEVITQALSNPTKLFERFETNITAEFYDEEVHDFCGMLSPYLISKTGAVRFAFEGKLEEIICKLTDYDRQILIEMLALNATLPEASKTLVTIVHSISPNADPNSGYKKRTPVLQKTSPPLIGKASTGFYLREHGFLVAQRLKEAGTR